MLGRGPGRVVPVAGCGGRTCARSSRLHGQGEGACQGLLSERENQVVKLIAEGDSSKEIAQLLVISIRTVDRHRENILEKLGMRDRTEF